MPGFTAGWIYISIIALRELSTSILLYSYNSTVLSIMAFDLWEGGQYTYVCALRCVDGLAAGHHGHGGARNSALKSASPNNYST